MPTGGRVLRRLVRWKVSRSVSTPGTTTETRRRSVEVAEDLGGPAGSRRVEGEDVPARGDHRLEAVHPAAGLVAARPAELRVVHALRARPAGPRRARCGWRGSAARQGRRSCCRRRAGNRSARRSRWAAVSEGKKRASCGGPGVRVGQVATADARLVPGSDSEASRGPGDAMVVADRGPAGGGQHHEHHGQREQCAPGRGVAGPGSRGGASSEKEDTAGHPRRSAGSPVEGVSAITFHAGQLPPHRTTATSGSFHAFAVCLCPAPEAPVSPGRVHVRCDLRAPVLGQGGPQVIEVGLGDLPDRVRAAVLARAPQAAASPASRRRTPRPARGAAGRVSTSRPSRSAISWAIRSSTSAERRRWAASRAGVDSMTWYMRRCSSSGTISSMASPMVSQASAGRHGAAPPSAASSAGRSRTAARKWLLHHVLDGEGDLLLAGEVAEEGALGDLDGVGDLVDGRLARSPGW